MGIPSALPFQFPDTSLLPQPLHTKPLLVPLLPLTGFPGAESIILMMILPARPQVLRWKVIITRFLRRETIVKGVQL